MMTYILLPQEISELDTFTLQEHIEAIQKLATPALYAEILTIAKLELIQRLEIEEFGRKLANDQYQIEEEIILPKIINKPTQTISFKTNNLSTRRQIVAKLQMNMASGITFLKVGKPTIPHHYKPAKNTLQPKQSTKKFLKAKKQDKLSDKRNLVIQKSSSVKKHPIQLQVSIKKVEQIQVKKEEVMNKMRKEQKVEVVTEQFSLKQKLKRQVSLMRIDYRQNDVYEELRQIKLLPQNLILQELKIKDLKEQLITTEISQRQANANNPQATIKQNSTKQTIQLKQIQQEEICQQISTPPENNRQIQKKEQKQLNFLHFNKYQFQSPKEREIKPYSDKIEEFILDDFGTHQIIKDSGGYHHDEQQPSPEIIPKTTPKVHKQKESFSSSKIIYRQVSKSYKAIPKKSYQSNKNGNIDKYDVEIIQNKVQSVNSKTIYHPKASSMKFGQKEDPKNNKMELFRLSSTHFNKPSRPELFQYNEIISSFSKLFPHSKNLLITLRNIQQNLKLHFSKSIDQRSRHSQYLRLNEHNITFRVVSQSQKAKKHANLFNISLDSFYKRGATMIDRVNQDYDRKVDDMLLYRVVRTKEEVYDIINCSFHRTKKWYELPHGMELKMSWNLLWTWSKPQIDISDLFYFQKINHFFGNKQIARKDLLKKNIENIKKLNAKMKNYFDIIPQTFLLPGQNIAFIKKFRQYGTKDSLNYWILKPVGLSRGRGIELVNKLEDVVFSEPVVLQKYIDNPLLIDGYKFDMRIYVLVTSMNPLEAFIYKQGFARLSTQKYSLNEDLMDNKFIHLTNFSINKQNAMKKQMTALESLGGCKITLKMLSDKLQKSGIEWVKIQKQMQQIILKSLISCMNTIPQNPNCFELFGYDIFIDNNLKCWLIEVNSSPSLEKEYTLDEIIKQQLVDDIIQIVNPISYDRLRLLEIVQRRRKEAEGLKSSIITSTNSTWQFNEDLNYVLHGKKLRKYGEPPENNNFKILAPSERYFSIIKTLQQYKVDPIIKGDHVNN